MVEASNVAAYNKVKINKMFEFDGVNFWYVDGNKVHSEFDKRWRFSIESDGKEIKGGEFIGGHYYVFPYIPENEVWISDLDDDIPSTMIHEYIERLLMKNHDFSYTEAHDITSNIEEMINSIRKK